MFEGIVANILATLAGDYLENVDSNSVSLSVLKGMFNNTLFFVTLFTK